MVVVLNPADVAADIIFSENSDELVSYKSVEIKSVTSLSRLIFIFHLSINGIT
jgi:hypothetical protein